MSTSHTRRRDDGRGHGPPRRTPRGDTWPGARPPPRRATPRQPPCRQRDPRPRRDAARAHRPSRPTTAVHVAARDRRPTPSRQPRLSPGQRPDPRRATKSVAASPGASTMRPRRLPVTHTRLVRQALVALLATAVPFAAEARQAAPAAAPAPACSRSVGRTRSRDRGVHDHGQGHARGGRADRRDQAAARRISSPGRSPDSRGSNCRRSGAAATWRATRPRSPPISSTGCSTCTWCRRSSSAPSRGRSAPRCCGSRTPRAGT